MVDLWSERYRMLGSRPEVEHVLIFENKGSLVGTSNPHPHCQIYAGNMIYAFTAREVESGRRFYERTGKFLGQEVLAARGGGTPRDRRQRAAFWPACPGLRAMPTRCSSFPGARWRRWRT